MKGTVYRSTGSWYTVKADDGRWWSGRMKGVFKLDEITSTNPIAVGDTVELEAENEGEGTAIITQIFDRQNYINRQSPRIKSQQHIVAANLDQSLLIATLREPRTSQGFIDRFLVGCELYHIKAILLFNKTDLYRQKERSLLEHLTRVYEQIGYPVRASSLKEEGRADLLAAILKDRTTLISGHSGVGKSTFINAILPRLEVRTQDVSGWSGKGQHTTTFAQMYDLPGGGRIIDTPGMKEFGLVGVERTELSGYFPEMRAFLPHCQFNNCLHIKEPGCAVKEAVALGKIDEERFLSYCNMLDSLDTGGAKGKFR